MHLVASGLSKQFGRHFVFRDLAFELPPGTIAGLMGINGAGKTTLLQCVATILQPTAGQITLDGETLRPNRLDLRRQLLYLPDFPMLRPEMTLLDQVLFIAGAFDCNQAELEEKIPPLLEGFHLLDCFDRQLGELSRGQAYKGSLTALLAVDPPLWLLDEPFASGMDPTGLTFFRQQATLAARERQRTILFTTQIPEVIESFADRIGILCDGDLQGFDPLDRWRQQPGGLAAAVETAMTP